MCLWGDQVKPVNEDEPQQLTVAINDAKNRMLRRSGFSPHQVAFWREPRSPGCLLDEDPDVRPNSAILSDPVYARTQEIRMAARRGMLEAADEKALAKADYMLATGKQPWCCDGW